MVRNTGSRLDDYLAKRGVLADADATAIKRVVAFQLARLMREQKISKSRLAELMGTSRSSLERLLDPDNPSVTLLTLQRAARALGVRIKLEIAA